MITNDVLINPFINSFKLLNGFFDSHGLEIPAQLSALLKHINAYIFAFEINIDINILLVLSCLSPKYLIGVFQYIDNIYITNMHRAFVLNECESIPCFDQLRSRGIYVYQEIRPHLVQIGLSPIQLQAHVVVIIC